MKRLLILLLILVVVAYGCAPKAVPPEEKPELVIEEAPESIAEVSEDVGEVGTLDEELDVSELDTLDEELGDITW